MKNLFKKFIPAAILALLLPTAAFACDTCGKMSCYSDCDYHYKHHRHHHHYKKGSKMRDQVNQENQTQEKGTMGITPKIHQYE